MIDKETEEMFFNTAIKMTIKDASRITGLPNSTLREMCAKGAIKGAELISGKVWMVPRAWVESRRVEVTEPGEGYAPLADAARSAGVSREALIRAVKCGKIVAFSRKSNERTRWFIKIDDPSFPTYVEQAKAWAVKLHKKSGE